MHARASSQRVLVRNRILRRARIQRRHFYRRDVLWLVHGVSFLLQLKLKVELKATPVEGIAAISATSSQKVAVSGSGPTMR